MSTSISKRGSRRRTSIAGQSACLLCSNGCGCAIAVKDGRMVGVRGRATDAVNHGLLGPKGPYGSTGWASSPDRLTRPLVRENGRLVETDWDTAMGRVVAESKRLLEEKGPLSHGLGAGGVTTGSDRGTSAGRSGRHVRGPHRRPPPSEGSSV
ncbi:MAG: molybdopterin-dependent oxidoreductase [Marmoricola sp.]